MGRIRLDVLVYNRGYAVSREKARALVMEGRVFVNGEREDKPGTSFDEDKIRSLEVKGDTLRYVSRGGLKLEKALQVFPVDLTGRVCLDVGASTGGFTDCMLQNNAARVTAVDVGYGQLDWKLRSDERVICMEKTNFRYLTAADFDTAFDLASADVSFISLDKILPVMSSVLKDDGEAICLIKPQFEAGREQVGKKGVVRGKDVHEDVIVKVIGIARECGFYAMGLDHSPIKGPEGNIEYLLFLRKKERYQDSIPAEITPDDIRQVVERAHDELR